MPQIATGKKKNQICNLVASLANETDSFLVMMQLSNIKLAPKRKGEAYYSTYSIKRVATMKRRRGRCQKQSISLITMDLDCNEITAKDSEALFRTCMFMNNSY
jgi:hypothetical protein